MRGINLNMTQTHSSLKLAISLIIIVLLLGSACTLFSPPPEPPPPEPENQPPVIHSITAEREVTASTESQISCEATDVDGDDLSYWWSAPSGGILKGEGDNITWVAPHIAGDYTIKATVTDGNGGEAIDSVTITVTSKPNQPPVIVGLTRDGNPAKEEEPLRIWRDTTIECIAEDPDGDELSFIWSATSGTVKGEGNEVKWIAPGVAGNHTITVRVSDGRGGEAEASMEFAVHCCGR